MSSMVHRKKGRPFIAGLSVLILCFLVVGLPLMIGAQDKVFLADKHKAKGLKCDACHQETPPKNAVPSARCLACHGDAEKLAMKTGALRPNPHDTHLGEMACEQCHHAHKPSVDACAKCHQFGLKVP